LKKNEIKLGAILSYVIIALNMITGIAYTPILTSKLGQSEYGLYSLISSIISYLTILDFGFGNAIIIYTARYRAKSEKEKEQKLHGMFLVIYTIIGFIAGLIGIILYINLDRIFGLSMTSEELSKAKILMLILTFNLVITFPLSTFSSIITAYEKFVFSKILNIIRIILNPLIMIVLLNMGYKSIALVTVITVLNITTLVINMLYCKLKLGIKTRFGKIDKRLLKEIFAYSFFVFLNSIINQVNWNVDQFILGAVSGTVAVAIYSTAGQLNTLYLNFSTAISNVLLPKVARMQENNASDEEFTEIFIKTGRIQYIVLALIITGFVLFGQEFINMLWVGPQYSQAYTIACILMIPVTIPLIQNIGISILQVKNLYKYRTIILFGIAILNIGISILLAPIWGGIGAAIGTAIALLLGQIIILNIFYYKKVHINIPQFWKEIFKMSIPVVIVFIFGIGMKVTIPINTRKMLLAEILIYSLLYIIVMYKFGINNYEKELFIKPIKNITKVKGD